MSPQEVIIISAEIIWKNKLQQQQEVEKRPGEKKIIDKWTDTHTINQRSTWDQKAHLSFNQ